MDRGVRNNTASRERGVRVHKKITLSVCGWEGLWEGGTMIVFLVPAVQGVSCLVVCSR